MSARSFLTSPVAIYVLSTLRYYEKLVTHMINCEDVTIVNARRFISPIKHDRSGIHVLWKLRNFIRNHNFKQTYLINLSFILTTELLLVVDQFIYFLHR